MSERILPDWITGYLKCFDNSEPPLLFKKWMAVSTLAAVVRRQCWIEWDSQIYPNLFVLLVGHSGCRKGTAMMQAYGLLKDLGLPLSSDSTTKEKLVQRLVNSQTSFIHPDTGTPVVHASLTIFSPEFVAFLGYENKGMISWLADWFDCRESWTYDTVAHGEQSIERIWVNLVGGITEVLLNQSLIQLAAGAGLTSRIIFVYGKERHKIVPLPIMTAEEVKLKSQLKHDLELIRGLTGGFCFTDAYFDVYAPWYETCEKTVCFSDPILEPYLTRRSVHLRKLSMLMNISRNGGMLLDKIDFDRALELLEETEQYMPRVFTSVGRLDKADMFQRVLAVIASKREVSAMELLRIFHKDLTREELFEIIRTLANMEPPLIVIVAVERNGKEAQVIRFNG